MAIFDNKTKVAITRQQLKEAIQMYIDHSFINDNHLVVSDIETSLNKCHPLTFTIISKKTNLDKMIDKTFDEMINKKPIQLKEIK